MLTHTFQYSQNSYTNSGIRRQAGFSFPLFGTLALRFERQNVKSQKVKSARKSNIKNGRLASLASNLLVTVPTLELGAKWIRRSGVPHSRLLQPPEERRREG